MVGEIRERETAEIAVQAALTGHLVLSTLHTNDSVGAVTRMIDMGVEPYLLSSSLIGVVAQRLVRSICPNCRTEYLASPELINQYGWQDKGNVRLSKGRGCSECYDSGYRGRMGIHEIIETDTDLQRLIIANASRDELTEYLRQHEVRLLFDDGIDRVLESKTTIVGKLLYQRYHRGIIQLFYQGLQTGLQAGSGFQQQRHLLGKKFTLLVANCLFILYFR